MGIFIGFCFLLRLLGAVFSFRAKVFGFIIGKSTAELFFDTPKA